MGHLAQLRRREKELLAQKIKLVVVTFEATDLASAYLEAAESQGAEISWPLLLDEKRELYYAYGMLSADFWDIWGPRTWWAYLKEILKGKWPKKSSGDVSQRGGDVLIDPDGVIRLHHVGVGPGDRPELDRILELVS